MGTTTRLRETESAGRDLPKIQIASAAAIGRLNISPSYGRLLASRARPMAMTTASVARACFFTRGSAPSTSAPPRATTDPLQ